VTLSLCLGESGEVMARVLPVADRRGRAKESADAQSASVAVRLHVRRPVASMRVRQRDGEQPMVRISLSTVAPRYAQCEQRRAERATRVGAKRALVRTVGEVRKVLKRAVQTEQRAKRSADVADEAWACEERPFLCGACGKRYATDGELQRGGGASGPEYGCRGGAFGWCRALDGPLPKREAALRQGQLSAAWKVQRKR